MHADPQPDHAIDLEPMLVGLAPAVQDRLRSLDLDMDSELLAHALDVELGLRARDPDLEVALEIVDASTARKAITPEEVARAAIESRRAAAMIRPRPADLDDDWFGRYDENDPGTHPAEHVEHHRPARGRLRRISSWLRGAPL